MLPSARRSGRIEYKAQVPEGTTLALQVRSSTNSNDLEMASWRAVGPSGQFEIQPSDRCMQYKAVFISDNGDRYPVLDKVSITIHR